MTDAAVFWTVTLIHAFWQTTIVAVLALVADRLMAPRSAHLRHTILFLALLKFAVPPGLAFPISFARLASSVTGGLERLDRVLTLDIDAVRLAMFVVAVHAAGMAAMVIRRAYQFTRLRGLIRRSTPAPIVHEAALREVGKRLGSRRHPALRISDETVIPFLAGWAHPTIVLPGYLVDASAAEIDRVLAHELAHLVQRDVLAHGFEALLAIVWWFDPAFHLVVRAARRAREERCDDAVLESGVASGYDYSVALVEIARRAGAVTPLPSHAAMTGPRSHPLSERLRRIADERIGRRATLTWWQRALVVGLALAALPGFSISTSIDRSSAGRSLVASFAHHAQEHRHDHGGAGQHFRP